MPALGGGPRPKPLQGPHPPIVVTAVAPFSKGVTEAAARGWDPISANFLMPQWVKSHWPKYVEGCERVGRLADPANWRVAKSIFVADDDKTAQRYATAPDGPYRYYYSQLLTKLKRGGRAIAFKTKPDQPDDDVSLDAVCEKLVFWDPGPAATCPPGMRAIPPSTRRRSPAPSRSSAARRHSPEIRSRR